MCTLPHSAYGNSNVSFMQAVVVQRLLIYTEEEEVELWYGIVLVVCIFILQIIRISGDVFFWSFSCRTACRLRSGILTVTFRRLAHLRSLKQHSVGEVREWRTFLWHGFISHRCHHVSYERIGMRKIGEGIRGREWKGESWYLASIYPEILDLPPPPPPLHDNITPQWLGSATLRHYRSSYIVVPKRSLYLFHICTSVGDKV